MDDRYKTRGYSATLIEEAHGAYLTIRRNDVVVREVAVGVHTGGRDEPVQITIKRFRPKELREIKAVDDFGSENQ